MKKSMLVLAIAVTGLFATTGCDSTAPASGPTSTLETTPSVLPTTPTTTTTMTVTPSSETTEATQAYSGGESIASLAQGVLADEGIQMDTEMIAMYGSIVCTALDSGLTPDESVVVAYEALPEYSMMDHYFAHGVVIAGLCDHHADW